MREPRVVGPIQQLIDIYEDMWRDVRKEVQLPQVALDILMFYANHPHLNNARDFVEMRGVKSNIVSFNVDKLVCEGYMKRQRVPEDRRKIQLVITEKAGPLTERGRAIQEDFQKSLVKGIAEKDLDILKRTLEKIGENAEALKARIAAEKRNE